MPKAQSAAAPGAATWRAPRGRAETVRATTAPPARTAWCSGATSPPTVSAGWTDLRNRRARPARSAAPRSFRHARQARWGAPKRFPRARPPLVCGGPQPETFPCLARSRWGRRGRKAAGGRRRLHLGPRESAGPPRPIHRRARRRHGAPRRRCARARPEPREPRPTAGASPCWRRHPPRTPCSPRRPRRRRGPGGSPCPPRRGSHRPSRPRAPGRSRRARSSRGGSPTRSTRTSRSCPSSRPRGHTPRMGPTGSRRGRPSRRTWRAIPTTSCAPTSRASGTSRTRRGRPPRSPNTSRPRGPRTRRRSSPSTRTTPTARLPGRAPRTRSRGGGRRRGSRSRPRRRGTRRPRRRRGGSAPPRGRQSPPPGWPGPAGRKLACARCPPREGSCPPWSNARAIRGTPRDALCRNGFRHGPGDAGPPAVPLRGHPRPARDTRGTGRRRSAATGKNSERTHEPCHGAWETRNFTRSADAVRVDVLLPIGPRTGSIPLSTEPGVFSSESREQARPRRDVAFRQHGFKTCPIRQRSSQATGRSPKAGAAATAAVDVAPVTSSRNGPTRPARAWAPSAPRRTGRTSLR